MPLFSFAVVISRFTKMGLLIAVLLFSAISLKAQDAVYLKNRYSNDYIGFWKHELIPNAVPALWLSTAQKKTLWYIERVDDTWIRFKDKDGNYLNVEKGNLEASKVPPGFFSAQWKVPVKGDYNLIINRWTGVYLHNERMQQEASAGEPGWWSAQWSMEDKNGNALVAKDFSLNAYTSLLPSQQSYYKFENIKAESTPVFLDINRAKSTELASLGDYSGDNSGKAWKFTLVSDGWYKISNLKLGGNKILSVQKNTDGTFYFVLTDFANYPNQLWRMIQYKDPTLLKFFTEYKVKTEKFSSSYYTLVSKQHHLEALATSTDINKDPRLAVFTLNNGIYKENPFDIFWKLVPVEDIAAIKNIPLSEAEQIAIINEAVNNANKITNDAILKGTPISKSPFKFPEGHIKGEPYLLTSGGGFGNLLNSGQVEWSREDWDAAAAIAGKIPIGFFNNSNFGAQLMIKYKDELGMSITRNFKSVAPGKEGYVYLDPNCTYVEISAVTESAPFLIVYSTPKYVRVKGIKIYLDGNVNNAKGTIWDW